MRNTHGKVDLSNGVLIEGDKNGNVRLNGGTYMGTDIESLDGNNVVIGNNIKIGPAKQKTSALNIAGTLASLAGLVINIVPK